ncbi:hypothetical protein BLNAU_1520 [Blattamonas nauphoetae]|uniref:Uncharacterized protein n=1 Tax=Blattamonas nauphoetae TaxID=2049346 RepID=A0ABQ9YIB1_9EUKA|nr:hypothetical protein BLNAU_1520 [Blattamonas nauphoetae]
MQTAISQLISDMLQALSEHPQTVLNPGHSLPTDILGYLVVLQTIAPQIEVASILDIHYQQLISTESYFDEMSDDSTDSAKHSLDRTLTSSERLLFWLHGQSFCARDSVLLWARYILPLLTAPFALDRHQQAHRLVGFSFLSALPLSDLNEKTWREAMLAFTTTNPISEILYPVNRPFPQIDSRTPHFSSALACVHKLAMKMGSTHTVTPNCVVLCFDLCCTLFEDCRVEDEGTMQRVLLEWIWTLMQSEPTDSLGRMEELLHLNTPFQTSEPVSSLVPSSSPSLLAFYTALRWIISFIPFKAQECTNPVTFLPLLSPALSLADATTKKSSAFLSALKGAQSIIQNQQGECIEDLQMLISETSRLRSVSQKLGKMLRQLQNRLDSDVDPVSSETINSDEETKEDHKTECGDENVKEETEQEEKEANDSPAMGEKDENLMPQPELDLDSSFFLPSPPLLPTPHKSHHKRKLAMGVLTLTIPLFVAAVFCVIGILFFIPPIGRMETTKEIHKQEKNHSQLSRISERVEKIEVDCGAEWIGVDFVNSDTSTNNQNPHHNISMKRDRNRDQTQKQDLGQISTKTQSPPQPQQEQQQSQQKFTQNGKEGRSTPTVFLSPQPSSDRSTSSFWLTSGNFSESPVLLTETKHIQSTSQKQIESEQTEGDDSAHTLQEPAGHGGDEEMKSGLPIEWMV